ncbi:MAG TPA: glycine--tRNA ligase subunit beta, partial [Trueperaceae bacterium]
MAELLFEIGTEELPSWYVTRAQREVGPLLAGLLENAGLPHGAVHAYATPRRIAVQVERLAERSEERTELRRGPAERVAFDAEGRPSRAAEGFARANGVKAADLVLHDTDKGRYVFAQLQRGGEPAQEVLPSLLSEVVSGLGAPRKMRWGEVATPFVRPISWLVALLDDRVLPVEAAGLHAGRQTRGHRFLSPGCLDLAHAGDYLETLEGAFVLADVAVRRERTWDEVRRVAAAAGLEPLWDEALLDEVANLLEWPFAVLGSFDEGFLELPDEVLVINMIHHQRFFPTRDREGQLAAFFVAVSNNRVPDEDLIRHGYEAVLAGRLYDARFFWDADRQKTLREHAAGLAGLAFHRRLGTMAEKVARVSEAARALAGKLDFHASEREMLEAALPIFRADLTTQMVHEFPELEGVMARAYALAEGYPEGVARVLQDGVRPAGPEAPLPESQAGALLATADRLDKLVGFFAVGARPTGSADPYGLRRDGIALARIQGAQGWSLPLRVLVDEAARAYGGLLGEVDAETREAVQGFVWDRVGGLLVEEGIRIEMIRAASAGNPPVIAAARRCHLLQALSREEDFATLLALYKRAANLAKEAREQASVRPELFDTDYEAPLY